MIGWAVNAMVGATILLLLVLALRRPVAHFLGAQWAYALWLLPLLRLLTPPALLIPSPFFSPAPAAASEGAMTVLSTAPATLDWVALTLAVWAGGAALYLSWQQSDYGAFLLHLGPEGKPGRPPEFGGIKVVESDAVDGPIALGIFNRRIVVPLDFATRYNPLEQQLALEHELIHHRRLDIWWNLAALLFLAINWFNPIAHLAFRAFRADQELACDAAVARRAPGRRADYARALVKSASQAGLIAAAPLNHAGFLKRRLKMMDKHRGGSLRAAGGLAMFLATAAGGLLLSSPGQAKADQDPVAGAGQLAAARADQPSHCSGTCLDVPSPVTNHGEIRASSHHPVAGDMIRAQREAQRALDDPEVQQSIGEAMAIAEQQVNVGEEVRLAVRDAQARAREAALVSRSAALADARRALATAHAQLASLDTSGLQAKVTRSVELALRNAAVTPNLSEEDRDEIREALEEARSEIEAIDFRADIAEAQREIEREMSRLGHLDLQED